MIKHKQFLKNLSKLAVLSVFPIIAACGGGGGEEDSSGSTSSGSGSTSSGGGGLGYAVVCFATLLVSGNDDCVTAAVSGGSSGSVNSGGSSPPTPPPPTSGGSDNTIGILGNVEVEPNNDLINANPVAFAGSTGKVGFYVDGTVDDVSDQADFFTFVRSRAREFRFQLCPPGVMICEQSGSIDTLTAYIDVLDQDGNVILSTQAAKSNVDIMSIDAGISYYVRVVAGDTMATTIGYRLTAYERN